MRPRIFVVQPVPEVALDLMREVADVEVYPYSDRQITVGELATAAARSDYIFTMHETIIPRQVLEANPKLKGIGIGAADHVDFIDVSACDELGIPLLDFSAEEHQELREDNARVTADLTVAMVLALAYRLIESDVYTRAGGFRQEMTMDLMGVGCPGKTVGLIGVGVVGKHLPSRFQAFDMDVIYTKRTRLEPDEEGAMGIEWVELDDLLARSDYVVMMANYNPSAHMLLGARELALMKPTAYLVNTGRGRLIDEDAMIAALQDGTIAGAGLDVFWHEPPVQHDPWVPPALRRLENVVLAPHNGGATWDSRGAQTSAQARRLVAAINAEDET